eukprot:Colp12_sorted_trinity150504_noHs@9048
MSNATFLAFVHDKLGCEKPSRSEIYVMENVYNTLLDHYPLFFYLSVPISYIKDRLKAIGSALSSFPEVQALFKASSPPSQEEIAHVFKSLEPEAFTQEEADAMDVDSDADTDISYL